MSIYHSLKSFPLLLEIFMNPPTSESFSLKHCKTVGNLTLLFKGLGLDPYFSQLCSFRFQKGLAEKTGPQSPVLALRPYGSNKNSMIVFFTLRS